MSFEIPPEVANFLDREAEQAQAFRAVADWRDEYRPLCLALSGLAGTGKTELAFRIARTLRDRDRDFEAVSYLDLDELRERGGVEIADALGDVLRSLGLDQQWLGTSLQERRRQYWRRTSGRRLIIIVDNARYGSEVVPLLPASGTSVAIVASQGRLSDLADGAATALAVEPLPDAVAMELLQRIADDARLRAEPDAVAELIRWCSGLPAAVRVAGGLIRRHRRRSLSRVLAEFTADVDEKGLPVVEKVWDAAYGGLSPEAALLYRLLANFPGPSFTRAAATATLGRGQDAADDALDELEEANLLDCRTDRMRLPELLRAHALRRARRDGEEDEAADGRRRTLWWHLRQAQRADAVAAGERLTLAQRVPALLGAPDVAFEDEAQAYRWLEAERHVLFRCVALAYTHGFDGWAWALCEPLWTHYLDHPHQADVVDAFGTGLAAAQRAEEVAAVVRMRCQLARPYWEQGRFDEAERQLELALSASQALGDRVADRRLKASVMEFRGMLRGTRGEWTDAAADFEASLQVHQAIGNEYGVMLLTYRLGQAFAELGRLERAATLLQEAHELAPRAGGRRRERMTARTGVALAAVLRRLGRRPEARELYNAALDSARRRGSTFDEARMLTALAALAEEAGDMATAREYRERVEALRRENGLA